MFKLIVFSKILICLLCIESVSSVADEMNKSQWQLFETKHFKLFARPSHKAWVKSCAEELEAVRALVLEKQNKSISTKPHVYLLDPYQDAQGFAIAHSKQPTMAFFVNTPLSDSLLGQAPNWLKLSILHEYIHLIHLAQQSRSSIDHQLSDFGYQSAAMTMNIDRWLAEGYATMMESRLTGQGRLYDGYIENVLQQIAREGALPRYNELSAQNNNYLSEFMPYFIGSRFLDWLSKNFGESSLDAVWTRWQGIVDRDFNTSFEGVFLSSAKKLYNRFIAEYTHKAMTISDNIDITERDRVKLWFNLTGDAKSPALSPDNHKLALIETENDYATKIIRLKVYSTAKNIKAHNAFIQMQDKILRNDPLDIPDKKPPVFDREEISVQTTLNHAQIISPRWLDNETIIYSGSLRDDSGVFKQQLFRWNLTTDRVQPIPNTVGFRRFDVARNSQMIYAERNILGQSQLVSLSLKSMAVTPLSSPSLSIIFDFPRINDQETLLAFLQQSRGGKWQLLLSEISTGKRMQLPLPNNHSFVSFPEWEANSNAIYFVAGVGSRISLFRSDIATLDTQQVTDGAHPIAWPMAMKNQDLLFLSINADGPDIYSFSNNNNVKTLANRVTPFNHRGGQSNSVYSDQVAIDEKQAKVRTGIGSLPESYQGQIKPLPHHQDKPIEPYASQASYSDFKNTDERTNSRVDALAISNNKNKPIMQQQQPRLLFNSPVSNASHVKAKEIPEIYNSIPVVSQGFSGKNNKANDQGSILRPYQNMGSNFTDSTVQARQQNASSHDADIDYMLNDIERVASYSPSTNHLISSQPTSQPARNNRHLSDTYSTYSSRSFHVDENPRAFMSKPVPTASNSIALHQSPPENHLKGKLRSVDGQNCWVEAGKKYNVDPWLLYSIASVESSQNPEALNTNSNTTTDIGLMQINSFWLPHLEKFEINEQDLLEPCTNIHVGAWVLAQSIEVMGDSWQAVGAYNVGTGNSNRHDVLRQKYAEKVYKRYIVNQQDKPSKAKYDSLPKIIRSTPKNHQSNHQFNDKVSINQGQPLSSLRSNEFYPSPRLETLSSSMDQSYRLPTFEANSMAANTSLKDSSAYHQVIEHAGLSSRMPQIPDALHSLIDKNRHIPEVIGFRYHLCRAFDDAGRGNASVLFTRLYKAEQQLFELSSKDIEGASDSTLLYWLIELKVWLSSNLQDFNNASILMAKQLCQ